MLENIRIISFVVMVKNTAHNDRNNENQEIGTDNIRIVIRLIILLVGWWLNELNKSKEKLVHKSYHHEQDTQSHYFSKMYRLF